MAYLDSQEINTGGRQHQDYAVEGKILHGITFFTKLPLELREMVWKFYLLAPQPRCIILIHDNSPKTNLSGPSHINIPSHETSISMRVFEAGSDRPYYKPTPYINREVYATAKRLKRKLLPQLNIVRDIARSADFIFPIRYSKWESIPVDWDQDFLYIAVSSPNILLGLADVRWASWIRNLAVDVEACDTSLRCISNIVLRLEPLRQIFLVTPVTKPVQKVWLKDKWGFLPVHPTYKETGAKLRQARAKLERIYRALARSTEILRHVLDDTYRQK